MSSEFLTLPLSLSFELFTTRNLWSLNLSLPGNMSSELLPSLAMSSEPFTSREHELWITHFSCHEFWTFQCQGQWALILSLSGITSSDPFTFWDHQLWSFHFLGQWALNLSLPWDHELLTFHFLGQWALKNSLPVTMHFYHSTSWDHWEALNLSLPGKMSS